MEKDRAFGNFIVSLIERGNKQGPAFVCLWEMLAREYRFFGNKWGSAPLNPRFLSSNIDWLLVIKVHSPTYVNQSIRTHDF